MSEDTIVINFEEVISILKLPLIGTEEQIKQTKSRQEIEYRKLIAKFKGQNDEEGRKNSIESGVAEELTTIIETRDFTQISAVLVESLEHLTYPGSFENRQLLYERKNPYPGLFRLLGHQDSDVVLHALKTIGSIIYGGVGTTPISEQHPHFSKVAECDGIQKLFSIFQKASIKLMKDTAAVAFGRLFRAHEIQDKEMKSLIINHLKSIIADPDQWTSEESRRALNLLARNKDNLNEIMNEQIIDEIYKDLNQPFRGNDQERELIQQKLKQDCLLLFAVTEQFDEDDDMRMLIINKGIAKILLQIFET